MKQEKPSVEEREFARRQDAFLDAVEGIGDILVFDSKRLNNSKEVLSNLRKLTDLVRDLFAMRDRDPRSFERMVLAQKMFNLLRDNPKEAEFRFAFDARKSLIAFSTALDQIRRVHEAALEARNDEVSRHATYNLNWLLADLSQKPENSPFIEQILKQLQVALRAAAKTDDASAYAASVDWYVDIVFKGMRQREDSFRLEYLPVFDRYLMFSVQFIVAGGHKRLFDALVSSLIDGIILDLPQGEVWDYGHVLMKSNFDRYRELDAALGIERRLQDLSASQGAIDSQDKLSSWLERFGALKKELAPYLTEDDVKKTDELEKTIVNQISESYKHNNLVGLVFRLGAYCLAKGRPEYVRQLWDYKQPPDSEATWIGHDVVPTTLKEVLDVYFRPAVLDPEFSLLEGHRSIVPYVRKYFLLVLGRLLQGETKPSGYDFSGWDAPRLSDISGTLRRLIPLSRPLADDLATLATLGFDPKEAEEVFGKRLPELLTSVANLAEERIAEIERDRPVSQGKVIEFRSEVLKEYKGLAALRAVYAHFGRIVAHDDAGGLERWGVLVADAKGGFLDDWYVHYVGWGRNYGQRTAIGEDTFIADRLVGRCIRIEPEGLDSAVKSAGEKAIILAARRALLAFELGARFSPAWRATDSEKPNVQGFQGWYLLGERKIPVFEFLSDKSERRVIILSSEKLGELHQFDPLNPNEPVDDRVENLLIKVRSYSQDEDLMKTALEKPPKWLAEIEGDEKRRNHLKTRVLVSVLERLDIRLSADFVGWTYNVPKDRV